MQFDILGKVRFGAAVQNVVFGADLLRGKNRTGRKWRKTLHSHLEVNYNWRGSWSMMCQRLVSRVKGAIVFLKRVDFPRQNCIEAGARRVSLAWEMFRDALNELAIEYGLAGRW